MKLFKLPHLEIARIVEIRKDIFETSQGTFSYYLMLGLAVIIATFGLLSNSAAVVIGAMLIAPLMGPIFGISLGVLDNDGHRISIAARAEVLGALVAVLLAFLIGTFIAHPAYGSEVLSRTNPTIYDILIALAAGAAGAYSKIDKRISASLTGTAIATALMPPLAVAGLCLAEGLWIQGGRALLLFSANFISIQLAAAAIFGLFKISSISIIPESEVAKTLVQRMWKSVLALVIAAAILVPSLIDIINSESLRTNVETVIKRELTGYSGAALATVEITRRTDGTQIIAEILTPEVLGASAAKKIETTLQQEVDPSLNLILRSIVSNDVTKDGLVYTPAQKPDSPEAIQAKRDQEERNKMLSLLSEEITATSSAKFTGISTAPNNGRIIVTAKLNAPAPLSLEVVTRLEQMLRARFNKLIDLVVETNLSVRTTSTEETAPQTILGN